MSVLILYTDTTTARYPTHSAHIVTQERDAEKVCTPFRKFQKVTSSIALSGNVVYSTDGGNSN